MKNSKVRFASLLGLAMASLVLSFVLLRVVTAGAAMSNQQLPSSNATFWYQSATGTTSRVSISSDGSQGNGESWASSISVDGRYVAFRSNANNLVPGDTNGTDDIFVHDRQTGQTSRISIASDGTQGNGGGGSPYTYSPSISADSRYIAFRSAANNLVPGDTNDQVDIFVHDRQTGQTSRVSVASDGSQGEGESYSFSISADGRYVAFNSTSSNLVPGDTNDYIDAFVHDRQTGQTSRVSVASDGSQCYGGTGPLSISANGRYVAFDSMCVIVPGDNNFLSDVFVHDRQTGQTSQVSVASDGTQGEHESFSPSISADGRYVTFSSFAPNLVPGDTNGMDDVFVHDRQTGQTSRVSLASDGSQGNNHSSHSTISDDGRYITFRSLANNLVPDDSGYEDVFVHDRQTGQTSRVSIASDGSQGNGSIPYNHAPSISADGRYIAFSSWADNLVPGDTNDVPDSFVHDRLGAYTISGQIIRNDGYPLQDVVVDFGSGTTVTDLNGYYSIADLPAGTYTITPFHVDYQFAPLTRNVTVGPDATGQDFTGIGCLPSNEPNSGSGFCPVGTPPLLNIPLLNIEAGASGIPYKVALLGNVDGLGPGRVNSWFDHTSPNQTENDDITLWTGERESAPETGAFSKYNCRPYLGKYCYDGHEGIDFQQRPGLGRNVLAAAGGYVHCTTPAQAPHSPCPVSPLGNQVWINHGDGYVTIYGHLSQVIVQKSQQVVEGQLIGVMGNTGCGPCGIHLHFEVRYDPNGIWPFTSQVDPYGCASPAKNCWTVQGMGSEYLWKYPVANILTLDAAGGTLQSPTGLTAANVSPGALSSPVLLQLMDLPPAQLAIESLLFAGSSFRFAATLPTDGNNQLVGEFQFHTPVEVLSTYTVTSTRHLDVSQLSLYRLDTSSENWMPLSSSVDLTNHIITAQTLFDGEFSVQAPLLCPEDVTEPNDSYDTAIALVAEESEITERFDVSEDRDWHYVDVNGPKSFLVQVDSMGPGIAMTLRVYDVDGVTEIASVESSGGEASLSWRAQGSGRYFIEVLPSLGSATGCDTSYDIQLIEMTDLYLPLLQKLN